MRFPGFATACICEHSSVRTAFFGLISALFGLISDAVTKQRRLADFRQGTELKLPSNFPFLLCTSNPSFRTGHILFFPFAVTRHSCKNLMELEKIASNTWLWCKSLFRRLVASWLSMDSQEFLPLPVSNCYQPENTRPIVFILSNLRGPPAVLKFIHASFRGQISTRSRTYVRVEGVYVWLLVRDFVFIFSLGPCSRRLQIAFVHSGFQRISSFKALRRILFQKESENYVVMFANQRKESLMSMQKLLKGCIIDFGVHLTNLPRTLPL